MLLVYKPSGRFSPSVFMLVPVLIAAAAGSAWGYQFLVRLIPLVFIGVFIVVGFGVLLSYGVGQAMEAGKCRNALVGLVVGLLVGVSAFAAAHYFAYLGETANVRAAGHAISFQEYVRAKVDMGWRVGKGSSMGLSITGWMVWVVWAIEGLILVGGSLLGGAGGASQPFCESCGHWAKRKICEFGVANPEEAAAERVKGAASVAEAIKVANSAGAEGAARAELRYEVKACPICEDFSVLTVKLKTETVDKKGKKSESTSDVLSNVVLTREEREMVEARGKIMG